MLISQTDIRNNDLSSCVLEAMSVVIRDNSQLCKSKCINHGYTAILIVSVLLNMAIQYYSYTISTLYSIRE